MGNTDSETEYSLSQIFSFSIVYQCILFVIAAMVLDGGQSLQYCIVAAIAFWSSIIVSIAARGLKQLENPKFLLYLKWGYFYALAVTPFLMIIIWMYRGVF